jgi:hypothetical protein
MSSTENHHFAPGEDNPLAPVRNAVDRFRQSVTRLDNAERGHGVSSLSIHVHNVHNRVLQVNNS